MRDYNKCSLNRKQLHNWSSDKDKAPQIFKYSVACKNSTWLQVAGTHSMCNTRVYSYFVSVCIYLCM